MEFVKLNNGTFCTNVNAFVRNCNASQILNVANLMTIYNEVHKCLLFEFMVFCLKSKEITALC